MRRRRIAQADAVVGHVERRQESHGRRRLGLQAGDEVITTPITDMGVLLTHQHYGSALAYNNANSTFARNQDKFSDEALAKMEKGIERGAAIPGTEVQLFYRNISEVYRALDTRLNRAVAVKVLADDVADAAARRFAERKAALLNQAATAAQAFINAVSDAGNVPDFEFVSAATPSKSIGGFRGGLWDEQTDVEYTFYGLGTLALAALMLE